MLNNFAFGKYWKQTAGYRMIIEREDERKFITVTAVSSQNAKGLLIVYITPFAKFYSPLELHERADKQGIGLNLFIAIRKSSERLRDHSPPEASTIHPVHEPDYEDTFVGTIFDVNISTPQSSTAPFANTLYGTHMD